MPSHILRSKHWRVRRMCPHCQEVGRHLISCASPYMGSDFHCLACGCKYGSDGYRRPSPWMHKRKPVLARLRKWYATANPGGWKAFMAWLMEDVG